MKFQMPFNSRIQIRLFERLETSHKDDFYVDSGLEIGENKHAIGIGLSSPLVSAQGADVTGPIVKDFTDKPKTTPPSDKTEGDTPVTPVDVVSPTEETPVDSEDEPEAPSDVETPHDVITRKGEEALDEEDDGTGQTFMD